METDLGWGADANWLVLNAQTVIGTLVEGSPGASCPEAYAGFVVGVSGGHTFTVTAVSGTSPVYVGSFRGGTGAWTPLLFSLAPFTFTQTGGNGIGDWGLINGWYAKEIWGVSSAYTSNVPVCVGGPTLTRSDIINYLAGSATYVDFKKSQNGYCVTCCVKWREEFGGDVYFSPVQISTVNANTFWDINGNVPIQQLTEHEFRGANFFMRLSKLYTAGEYTDITSTLPVLDYSEGIPLTSSTLFAFIAANSHLYVGFPPGDEDPYAGGGTSEPGGGGGSFDNTSDQIDDSTTPVFSFAGSGFCRIYNPNLSQLQNLANYLWTDTNFLQTIVNHAKQLLEDPIEAVISLAMLPVSIPQGTSETVKVLFISTGVSMPPATTQYVEVDCGAYNLEEYYGSALDYNPYTQVDLFLPFIGQVSLNTDEVMGHTIGVKYRVDIVSGLCVAKVFVDNDCMYQFSGNCAIFMPLNSADFSSYLSAAMTAATALVSAGAGMAAGASAAGAEAVAEPAIQTGGNLLTSGESLVTPQMALQYRVEESVRPMYSPSSSQGSPASLGEMERKFINNSAAAVMGSKISFEHASHLAGNSGILGIRRPYLIINRPDMCNPENYGKYNGRPCMMYLYLGNLTGYTEVQEIQLTGFSATNPELSEISKMLKGGVIF